MRIQLHNNSFVHPIAIGSWQHLLFRYDLVKKLQALVYKKQLCA